MGKYTKSFSYAITKYLPFIALASSLYGAAYICESVVLFVVALPYVLIAVASLMNEIPRKAKLASIILYIEIILLVSIKYVFFNTK
ncbi:MAG: hypothetical protein F7C82_04640 [Desulfurococcales archaeon]|nr:hypothetical protein [Desulfurococcales archaeon]